MNKMKLSAFVMGLMALTFTLQSCELDDNDSYDVRRPSALVTVRPQADKTFTMQLDDKTTLTPSNMQTSPFGDKEVRALVNYTEDVQTNGSIRSVHINWIDSIRTKLPVVTAGADNDKIYGNDPIEIVRDWVTVAEDGYLTLRIRTRWGSLHTTHYINLLTGTNPENPYELELRHDAKGDIDGAVGDALVAFNLNNLPKNGNEDLKLKLNWTSFSGKKSAEFSLHLHDTQVQSISESMPLNSCVE